MTALAVLVIAVYGVGAVTVAAGWFFGANRMREPDVPAPDNMGSLAVLAGFLWPVVVMGVAQVGMLVALHSSRRSAVSGGGSSPPMADG